MYSFLTMRLFPLLSRTLQLLCFLSFIFFARNATAQLDSISGTITLETRDYQDGDSVIPQNWLVLTLVPNDLDDLGFLSIVVYSHIDGSVLRELTYTKQDLINANLIVGDTIVMDLLFYDPYFVHRVCIYPQTNAEAYVQELILFYPPAP